MLLLNDTGRGGEDAKGDFALACVRGETELEQDLEQVGPRIICLG